MAVPTWCRLSTLNIAINPRNIMNPSSSLTRLLLVLVAFSGLLVSSLPAQATTWYVRTDGGTSTQCTGTTDAAYPGSGNGQACAFNHPFWALQPGQRASNFTPTTVMQPGDTLVIDSGSYMIGYGAPNSSNSMCYQPATWGCAIASIPSGIDASHPTIITGANCSAPPQLWGTQRLSSIFDIESEHDITIKCLELTDHSMCIDSYQPTTNTGGVTACNRSSYPYGTWASNGIYASDDADLTLQNLNIHGFADYGINSGRLSGNTLLDGVTLRANGWGGWSGDLGGNNHNSTDSGTITVRNSTVAWNGCAEAYPSTTIVGCWGQNEGGYGDGFAEAWTGGTWVFTNDNFIANTQDGLDMLYANGTGSVTMDRLYASENAGNGIKSSGPATLTNSIVNGYCDNWAGFPIAGDGSSGVAGTMCRADGTAVVMEFNAASGQTVTLAYNTITGDGDTLFVGGGDDFSVTPDATDVVSMANNIWLGQISAIPRDGGNFTALDYYSAGTYAGTVNYTNNIIWNVKNSFCPSRNICKDPQLTDEVMTAFNANPLVSSPAIGNANSTYTVPVDYYDNTRPTQGATIGAVEYEGSSSSQAGTPIANFTYSASGLTANFADTSTDTGGSIGSWSWSFGDGTSSSAQSPSHAYAAAGTYQVSETVTDKASGKTSTSTQQVVVSASQPVGGTPSANFTYSASGLTANFTDTSTDAGGSIGSWSWSFGDGANSSAQSPTHTYAAAGTYQVSETVTDKVNGRTSTSTAQVLVTAPRPFIGQGAVDSPLPPSGGTQPASDAPVPGSPGTATMRPALGYGGQHSGLLRGSMQTGLDSGRPVDPVGSVSVGQVGDLNQVQSSRTAVNLNATQAVHDANTAAPGVSTAQSEIPVVRAEPATRSYVSVVSSWFADVYSQYRQMLSRWSH